MRRSLPSGGPLLTRGGLVCGGWSCLLAAGAFASLLLGSRASPSLGGLFNDFADYWGAARILDLGGDPYDRHLLAQVLGAAGVHTTIGTGYSYPLLLAELLRPIGLLPPPVAAALFTACSLACLGLGVALLLTPLIHAGRAPSPPTPALPLRGGGRLQGGRAWLEAFLLATAAGLFVPVDGSLYFGQVNPCLLPALALALRGVARPGALAVATAVKLYPAAAILAFGALGRRGLRPLLAASAAAVGLAVGPNLVAGRWSYGGSVVAMFGPDPYWSNQSINGLLSRLALPSHVTQPPLPGLPVTALMLAVCAALGALAAAVAARRRASWPGAFALLLCYGAVAAPKNSIWNYAPLVVVLVYTWTLVRGRAGPMALLALAWALMDGQGAADAVRGNSAAGTWLTSVPLYGALLLGAVLAWALLRPPREHDDPMPELDLVIRGGEVVNVGSAERADVGIAGGSVVQVGGELRGRQEIDATGLLLLPGAIDAHVHLSSPPGRAGAGPRWVDDFTSGSRAALAGGVTTVGNMTFLGRGETPLAGLAREAAVVREQAIADVICHPVVDDVAPAVLDEIPRLLDAGSGTIKCFLSFGFDAQAAAYVRAIRAAGESGLLTMLHCEDEALLADAVARLVAAGRTSLRHYAESRPAVAEVVATQRAVAIAEATGAPVYVVHLSCARALEVCAEARARGVPVSVETRPMYLHLTAERLAEPDGAKYVGQPPLRDSADVEALWAGIRDGVVQTVCTDHAPWSLDAKLDPALSITRLRPGVENLGTLVPMLWSEGVRAGRISRDRFVEVTSANAARLFGLHPRKGVIAAGSDADIVVFDPELTRTVGPEVVLSNAGHSVYDGWSVTGWPVVTVRRGEVVFRGGEVLGRPGSGSLLRPRR